MPDRSDTKVWETQYDSWAEATDTVRPLIERDRDYVDHKQWTSSESAILLGRGQAPIVMNRIKPKVDFIRGIEAQSRTDPKAFPRTPDHEQDAEAITDALRFVADNTDFDQVSSEAFDELIVEGTEAAIVEVEKNPKDEFEIHVRHVPWDRFYHDGHSRKRDFSDASFCGITTWMHIDQAQAMFPNNAEDLKSITQEVAVETHEDRPRWIDKKNKRVRINEHYYVKGGVWHLVFFAKGVILRKAQESPYLDEFGDPVCPIEAQSLYVDRQNARYGAVRGLIGPQDEINHRRSKALHMLSSKLIVADKGVVKSGTRLMNQIRSGSAIIEKQTEGQLEIIDNNDFAQGQLALLQEAKGEIDAQGVNAALGGDDPRSQSGRALEARQAGGSVELTPILDAHRAWKRRIYRQIWLRIKQFWDEEKWVRVTDDENNIKFAGLNRPVTERERISREMKIPPEEVEAFMLEQGAQMMPGALDQVVDMAANVSELDVDIILAEAPDVVTIRQEQFAEITNLAAQYGPQSVPFDVILELSSLRNKDEVIERLRGDSPEAQQALQQAQQEQAAEKEAELTNTKADTAAKLAKAEKDDVEAKAKQLENIAVQQQLGFTDG